MEKAYINTNLNSKYTSQGKTTINSFFKSTKYFLTKEYIKDGDTFLDIGGASGEIPRAIKNDIADINVTIIDPDSKSIELGKNNNPDFEYYDGYYPLVHLDKKFNIVSMQALFPQLPNWKEMLLSMKNNSKKYINISLVFQLSGATVIDKDVSYFYYLDSGERVYQVIHNIYEFINFCCIYEMGVKKINFYGYHTPETGHNFRSIPNNKQIKGNLLLELFDEGENPKRYGGAIEEKEDSDYKFFVPEMDIIIDDKEFQLR